MMAWHYHDDDVAGPAAQVSLVVEGLGAVTERAQLQHYRIDAEHSNAYTVWQRMGSPQSPSPAQYAELERASELASLAGPSSIGIENGRATLAVTLPRQAVSLLIIDG